jgi:alkylated DNA repair dioxygenase AlkB
VRPVRDPACQLLPGVLTRPERAELVSWLETLTPLWEQRFSTVRPLPDGASQRALLRPVYWLGNWQFACLGYYEPPKGVQDRAVAAEPFPPVLRGMVDRAEAHVRRTFPPAAVPKGWRLDTCLINFYGSRDEGGREVDVARVGEHRDFEPGPVASLSIGARALFQFVRRGRDAGPPVRTMWLEDGALQLFGGPYWKDALLHRVQRVEPRPGALGPPIEGFRTRRINFTFRHVPPEHVVPYARLGAVARADVAEYVGTLAASSPVWARARATDERAP